jgi:hypothetical protein
MPVSSATTCIARGQAEISFWLALGASPQTGVWDTIDGKPAPAGQKPDTGIVHHPFIPYVADIDAARARTNTALRAASYHELESLLAIGNATQATGELGSFWVSDGDLTSLDDAQTGSMLGR